MSAIKKILAECWSELSPVQNQMTEKEREWFRKFLQAYYMGNSRAAAEITPSRKVFLRVLADTSPQKKAIMWLRKVGNDDGLRAVVNVTAKPKKRRIKAYHFEDILIEVLDSTDPVTAEVKPNSQRGKFASARFSVLDVPLIEIHYRLTPW